MARAQFNGRMQKVTRGRIADFLTTYNLACNPEFELDSGLWLFKDGVHIKAVERKGELDFLGNLDGIVIGIGGADPPKIGPEQITSEWVESAKKFFDPDKNPLSYFQRMILLKELILAEGIPVEKLDIVPKYPHHYYPSSVGLFESKPEDRAFQYLGVESDHHFHRVQTKEPNERDIAVLYHDYRGHPSSETRDVPVELDVKQFDERIFNMYVKRFRIMDDGSYGEDVEKSLDVMFEDSEKTGNESVLALICFSTKKDRELAQNRWGKPFGEVMKHTPFERFMMLKDYLMKKGVDLRKTHITFLPPDIVLGTTPSRSEAYIPNRFVYFTEDLGKPVVLNKNERVGSHSNCVGIRYTNK